MIGLFCYALCLSNFAKIFIILFSFYIFLLYLGTLITEMLTQWKR
jgi:hypothetical protein